MKPLVIALTGVGRALEKGDGGVDLANVQCKAIWNCHNESPYNEYMLIEMGVKKECGF
jgi:hypothetical protein